MATQEGHNPAKKQGAKKRGRPRIDREVRDAAYDLLSLDWSPKEIEQDLAQKYPDRFPSKRQIERYKRELAPRDPSGPWTLSEADGHGCSLVPPVLATVIERSSGRHHISIEEAKWIVRARLAAPSLDPWNAWLVARAYMRRQQQGESATDLDYFLAFAPWRDDDCASRYRGAVWRGWVAPPPASLDGLVRGGGVGPGPYIMGPQQTERYLESLQSPSPNAGRQAAND